MSDFIKQNAIEISFKKGEPWVILTKIEQQIKEKIEKYGMPLSKWDGIKINRGILTGCNEAFIIDSGKRNEILCGCESEEERQRTDKIIRPILRGRDIKQGSYEWAGLYLIALVPSKHYKIEEFPAIKHYLEGASWSDDVPNGYGKLKLEQTGKSHVVNGIKFTSRKATGNKWFETQDQIAYMDDLYNQKIVYSEIVQKPQFYFDKTGEFIPEASAFYLYAKDMDYLVEYLNNPLSGWIFKKYYAGGGLGDTGYRYKKAFFVNLPIPIKLIKNYFDAFNLTDEEKNYIESSLN